MPGLGPGAGMSQERGCDLIGQDWPKAAGPLAQ